MTLGDMLRHERSGAGMQDQRNLDAELARAITTDGKFKVCYSFKAFRDYLTFVTLVQDDLEYMDDNAERLGRKKMRTDAMKRQFAINGATLIVQQMISLARPFLISLSLQISLDLRKQ